MGKKATLKDVAQQAGVSPACVSMILSGGMQERFSPQTVDFVRATAKKLGYTPAVRKVSGRQIAILSPSVNNPYHTSLISGIDQAAFSLGYTTCVYNTYWNEQTEISLLRNLSRSGFCGIIFAYTPMRPDVVEELSMSFPIVAVGDKLNDLSMDTVDVNNYHSGEIVAEHLCSLGHKHVAYLSSGMDSHHVSRTRRANGLIDYYTAHCPDGKVSVIEERNPYEQEIQEPHLEYITGTKLAKRCLMLPDITAIVAINDMVGYGIYDTLIREGFSVPEDYSICGFDNIFPSQLARIDLTSVDNCTFSYGSSILLLLLNRIEQGLRSTNEQPLSKLEYLPKLIIRGSTGKPREQKVQHK